MTTTATMCEAFQATVARHADDVALRTADGATELTFAQYGDEVRRVAGGLAAIGVGRGDTVALMMTNRIEFYLLDTAAVHLGATPFSVYNTSSPDQIAYLLSNATPAAIAVETQFLPVIAKAQEANGTSIPVVCVDEPAEGCTALADLAAGEGFDFEAAWRAVEPGDVLTLIYTSGTTGPPKGVEITHANMVAECHGFAEVLPVRPGATITSYLPSAHIADRWSCHYNQMVFGVQITCVPDMRQIAAVLPELRPTVWGAVPRVMEKLKAALEAGIGNEPDEQRRAGLQKAIEVGVQKVRLEQAGEPVPEELAQAHAQLEEQVLSKLRAKLGLDRAEWVIVGAAPLSQDVQEFLMGIGLPLTELYGMSECSCCVTVVPPDEAKIGSVGRAIPGAAELKLAEDDELLVRGPIVMRGYRNEPEKTAEAIDSDGWLHTGDVATIDDDGYVRIVDRKKELIINAGGKNMSPANIEGKLKDASPLVGQAICIGDRRPYNVALLVLDPDAAAAYAQRQGLDDASVQAVAQDERVQQVVAKAIEQANEQLSRVEQIKRYRLLADEWQPGGDELTPTMKLKRKPIAEKYEAVIEELYA